MGEHDPWLGIRLLWTGDARLLGDQLSAACGGSFTGGQGNQEK